MIFPVKFLEGLNYIRGFQELTHVPREIPAAAIKIYLNNNVISNIKYGAFARNSHCLKLRLDQNRLTDIRKDMWTGLVALQWLSLEHNDIESTVADLGGAHPARAPPTAQNFLNFMQFFVKFGKIICWRPPWRVGAPSYGESWIRPWSIHSSAFADLFNLKGLYLHNNKLTTLPGNIFPPKQMLVIQILTIHGNSLNHDELDWLHNLCDSGRIREYTIRRDNVHCSPRNDSDVTDQPEYVTQGELITGLSIFVTDDAICVDNLGK